MGLASKINKCGRFSATYQQIFISAAPRHPRRLQNDKGKEIFNSKFAGVMKRYNIKHFASESDQTAANVERFNRTIKTLIWTYLFNRETVRWIDVI